MPITTIPITKSVPPTSKVTHPALQFVLVLIFLALIISSNMVISYHIFSAPAMALSLLCYLPVIIWNLLANLRASAALVSKPFSLILLCSLFVCSYFWSVAPSLSLKLILMNFSFTILAIFISICHKTEGFDKQLRTTIVLLMICVTTYAMAVPSSLVSQNGATSFFMHKNFMGLYMGLSVVVLLYVRERNWWHIGLAIFAGMFLLASFSKTSIAIVVISSVSLIFANWWIKKYYLKVRHNVFFRLLYPFSLLSLGALIIFRNQFLDFFWNNMDKSLLTGRGLLWLNIIQRIRGNSLLGIGPGTFWNSDEGSGSEISRTMAYFTNSDFLRRQGTADGSYADVIASVGVLGLALFLYSAIDLYRGLIRNWDRPDSKLIFVLTTFVIIHAVTETNILSITVLWLIYMLCYFRVAGYDQSRITAIKNK